MNDILLPDYLDHMQQAAADACAFVKGVKKSEFLGNRCILQAVIMSLIIIGEAATKVMNNLGDFVQAHAEIPWRSIHGMRNRIAHGYFDINLDLVWDTVQTELPSLSKQLSTMRDIEQS